MKDYHSIPQCIEFLDRIIKKSREEERIERCQNRLYEFTKMAYPVSQYRKLWNWAIDGFWEWRFK